VRVHEAERASHPSAIITVGHSTHPIEDFLELLGGAGVEQVVDVRRFPGSRRHPQYGAAALSGALAEREIGYEHVGALGGRRPVASGSCNDGWHVAGFRGYADYLRSPEFADGLARLEGWRGGDVWPSCAQRRSGGAAIAACSPTSSVCAAGRCVT
jgi:Protein of unknown function, DUF488